MDLEIAEPAADAAAGRRNLIGMAGVAGLAGAAAALLSGQSATAAEEDVSDRPNQPTDGDVELLRAAIGLELAARDLYRALLESTPGIALGEAAGVMAENHEAFAQAIAGATGLSAGDDQRNDGVFDDLVSSFETPDFAATAHTLEQTAVSTHTALLAEYESADAIALTNSIIVTEARHATVLAAALGVDDLDTLFGNDESALQIEGGA